MAETTVTSPDNKAKVFQVLFYLRVATYLADRVRFPRCG